MVVIIQHRLGHWLEARLNSGSLLAFELRGDVQRKAVGVALQHVVTDNAGRVCSSNRTQVDARTMYLGSSSF